MGPLDPHGPRCGAPAAPPSRVACPHPIFTCKKPLVDLPIFDILPIIASKSIHI